MVPDNEINYKKNILDLLAKNIHGLTVTDISEKLGISRNTVYRYIGMLEERELVFTKKIGAYNLYFTQERTMLPKDLVLAFYKGFIHSLKEDFKGYKDFFKDFGRKSAQYIPITLAPLDTEQIKSLGKFSNKYFLEIFGKMLPYFDPFTDKINLVKLELDEENLKAVYHFNNSDLLVEDDIYLQHFFIATGLIETSLKKYFDKHVKCDLIEYNLSENKNESSFKLSLEIIK